ncbi:MAG: hypothetical protein ACFBSF_19455 [Leptolyngbyaceae cyanobacterium]
MKAEILRLLWSMVLELSPDRVAELSDEALAGSLVARMNSRLCLNREDQMAVRSYLKRKRLLIREMVEYQMA